MMNYQKIDITVGPKLCRARLTQVHSCSCKFPILKSDAKIGKYYDADLRSVRWVKFQCFGCGKVSEIRVIDLWSELLIPQWFPLHMLDIDAKIPMTRKPTEWEPVKDNLVSPAHRGPEVRMN